jgi:hypothetical protein
MIFETKNAMEEISNIDSLSQAEMNYVKGGEWVIINGKLVWVND